MLMIIEVSKAMNTAEQRIVILGAIASVAEIRNVSNHDNSTYEGVVVEIPKSDISHVRHHLVAHLNSRDAMSVWGPLGGSLQPIIREI